MKKKLSTTDNLNLQPVRGAKGKQIIGMQVRVPLTQSNSQFPSMTWAVYDAKGQRVRGLWFRYPHGPFVAQITDRTPGGHTRGTKTNLKANTFAQAREEHQRLVLQSRDGCLPVMGKTPDFSVYAREYIQTITAERKKRPSTLRSECYRIEWWCEYLGNVPLNKLTLPVIRRGITQLAGKGQRGRPLSKRSLNYYATVIRNVLNRAIEDGWLKSNPIVHKALWYKLDRAERPLFTYKEKERLCAAALRHCPRNGQQLSDFINLMCYCGARLGKTLTLRWSDVDWSNKQLIIARDGSSKNRSSRRVDFNPRLEEHLLDMHGRRQDEGYLFPSGQRGQEGQPAKSFQAALVKAREAAGLGDEREEKVGKNISFHDCRHYFCSMAIMGGADYRTIADWLGHSDGGVLVGRTYGHLSDDHKRRVAKNLNLGPQIIDGGVKAA